MDRFGNGGFLLLLIVIALIPLIFFIRSIQKTLLLVSPQNRKIQPSLIWLTLIPIPIVMNIWSFIMVYLVADSIALEYRDRDLPFKSKPTLIVGMTMSIVSCLAYLPPFKKYTAILWFVFFFWYWAQIVQSKRDLSGKLADQFPIAEQSEQ